MATQWFPGRGSERGDRYVIYRNHLMLRARDYGTVSMPVKELPRLRKHIKHVVFVDVEDRKDKIWCDAENFRSKASISGDWAYVSLENCREEE